ncbi:MAG: DNA-binding response regulator [Moraxellaceae bacterium]|jgi:two-component system response regulator AlgR|nr:DNA-binding response regulator [Moraxellaceae bacterium]
MKVLICDDEALARERLARFLRDMDGYEVVGEAENGEDCLRQVTVLHPDIVLLDLRMPVMDGLVCAEALAQLPEPPAVIFCTAYDEHALAAFQVQAVGYLLKPVRKEQLAEAVGRAVRVNRAQLEAVKTSAEDARTNGRSHITAKTHRGIELIPVDDVRYFLADQKYVTVRHGKGEVLIDETLKDLENEFGQRFIRIHRNALLALHYLDGLELVAPGQYQVRIKGIEDRLVVSRRHLPELRETMQKL